jgi:dinuclear metal center YbgI/SA1388 family protein
VVDEAVAGTFDAVVAYHPPLFEAAKRFVAGSVAYAAARAGIAVFSPHTALDVAPGGTNDVLASALGLVAPRPLRPVAASEAGPPLGFGRVGAIEPATLRLVVERVKSALATRRVLVCGDLDGAVDRAAVCAGSGGDMIPEAVAAGAHVLLTGEVRHHDALRAAAAGLAIVATLHSVSERCVLPAVIARLAVLLPGVAFTASQSDRDPFVFA